MLELVGFYQLWAANFQKSKGLTMKRLFDKEALAAMAVDCHLKDCQLKKVMTHFHFTTGSMPSVAIEKQLRVCQKIQYSQKQEFICIQQN